MRIRNSGKHAIRAVALATVLALATVAPGGAFVSGASSGTSESEGLGGSFEAFVLALADDVIRSAGVDPETVVAGDTTVGQAVQQAVQEAVASAQPQTPAAQAAAVEQVSKSIQDVTQSLDDVDLGSLSASGGTNPIQTQQVEPASTQDVINALLALLTSAQPQVFNAIDLAEAAVIAKIDEARAQVVAGFAQARGAGATGLDELEAFALQQLDAAKVYVGQLFDQIRAMVTAAFDEARDRIIEELTGIDFGDAVDEVLAEIAAIEAWLQGALAGVQALLQDLAGSLPLP